MAGFLFEPLIDKRNAPLFDRILDSASGYGHQAVMVFFVLSGYLISKGVWNQRRSFNWSVYLVSRLTRLWVVLVPALVLTLLLNKIGINFDDKGYYAGVMSSIYHGQRTWPVDLSAANFLGNIAFLQTITVTNYGDNEVLWSLSNEFWYYMLFPALILVFHAKKVLSKIAHLTIAGLILALMPSEMLFLFLVWLMGFACHLIVSNQILSTVFSRSYTRLIFLLAFACALQATHSIKMTARFSDLMLGLFFSLLLISTEINPPNFKWANRPLILLSDMSYTLYLVHFPILTLIVTAAMNNPQLERNIYNFALCLGIAFIIFSSTYLMYYLFERNTAKVRRHFNALLSDRTNTELQS